AAHGHVDALRRGAAAVVDGAVADQQVVALRRHLGRRRRAAGGKGQRKQGKRQAWHGRDSFARAGHGSERIGRSSRHSRAAAMTASAASNRKNAGWLAFDHSVPTTPASRLPLKMARNQDATVVAPSRGGASLANRPSPVGRMYSSPRVRMTKNATTHGQSTRAPPASAVTVASSR